MGAGAVVAEKIRLDRVGLGWRPELAAATVMYLDRIDLIEVLADDYFSAPSREVRALAALASATPVYLHGVEMGLASVEPVSDRRLADMARLAERIQPVAWSEHLAFVRAGGCEIGHLAAPPRTLANIEGTASNVERAQRVVGSLPCLENIATLMTPPASELDEAGWLNQQLAACRAPMLLDLHNLYCNAINFGTDPTQELMRLPLTRVGLVHIAGGSRLAEGRLLDDHLHAVPDPIYGLLEEVAARASQPLDVVLERDGRYPPFPDLLAELDLARAALARGRARLAHAAVRAA